MQCRGRGQRGGFPFHRRMTLFRGHDSSGTRICAPSVKRGPGGWPGPTRGAGSSVMGDLEVERMGKKCRARLLEATLTCQPVGHEGRFPFLGEGVLDYSSDRGGSGLHFCHPSTCALRFVAPAGGTWI